MVAPWTAKADDLPEGPAAVSGKLGEVFSPFVGSFSQSVPIAVPAYRGLEPRLGLGYSSEGGNGLAGVGWSVAGFGSIQRAGAGRGTPRWDSTDIYLLNGAELLPCAGAGASCVAGGTYTTKNESYLKIDFDSGTDTWKVWGKDGTRTDFTPVYTISGSGTYRWGQTTVTATSGHSVTYTWSCAGSGTNLTGDCYPASVQFGPYSVQFHWEARNDRQHFATGVATSLGITTQRLRAVQVSLGTSIRAYCLTYSYSTVTSRSMLTSVQQFGKDVVIPPSSVNACTGSSLPARTFAYRGGLGEKAFQAFGN